MGPAPRPHKRGYENGPDPSRRVSAKAVFTDDWQTVAVTWEAGDETPEDEVREYARRAACLWAQSHNCRITSR